MVEQTNLEWRVTVLEDRVQVLSQRTHDLAGFSTENRLNIRNLKDKVDQTADKDDVERLETQVSNVNATVVKAAVAITGGSLSVAVAIIIAIATGGH